MRERERERERERDNFFQVVFLFGRGVHVLPTAHTLSSSPVRPLSIILLTPIPSHPPNFSSCAAVLYRSPGRLLPTSRLTAPVALLKMLLPVTLNKRFHHHRPSPGAPLHARCAPGGDASAPLGAAERGGRRAQAGGEAAHHVRRQPALPPARRHARQAGTDGGADELMTARGRERER